MVLQLQRAVGFHKSNALPSLSGTTAFSTVVATEVNNGWPSIFHTPKWSAGHKTLPTCCQHQSSSGVLVRSLPCMFPPLTHFSTASVHLTENEGRAF